MSEESSSSTEKKSINWFYVAIGVLALLIVLAGGYMLVSRNNQQKAFIENLGFVAQERMDEVDAQLTQCQGDLTVAKVAAGKCATDDMLTKMGYVNGPIKYSVSFDYPSSYYELYEASSANGGVAMYTNYEYEGMDYGDMAFFVTAELDQQLDEGSEEYMEIDIDGEEHMVYMFADGSTGGDDGLSSTTTYWVQANQYLYLYGFAVDKWMGMECEEESETCVDGIETTFEYATSDEEVEQMIEVMETFSSEAMEEVKGETDEIDGDEEAIIEGEEALLDEE